jgi:hypothetical protein
MDPIQPIGPRPPWIAELAVEQTRGLSRERRKTPRDPDRDGPRREPPREPDDPDGDGPADGRHIDVRA